MKYYNMTRIKLAYATTTTTNPTPRPITIISGGREPEGAGPSPLNSVSDSNMCPTENKCFSTYPINIFVSVCV